MITLISLSFVLLCIGFSARVVFHEYPESAISLARGNLFSLRDELFDLADAGKLRFDDPGYKAARSMINAFIRYAHDLSLTRLILTSVARRLMVRGKYESDWDRAINQLPKAQKKLVMEIVDEASMHMFRLLITRSVLLSALLLTALFLTVCWRASSALSGILIRTGRTEHVKSTDAVFSEVMQHYPGRSFKQELKREARRYVPAGVGLPLAA